MSSEQRYDRNMLEQTKQQIRTLMNEIAQISRTEVTPEKFQTEFLTRVVRALGAIGGALWLADDSGRLSLGYQINLREAKLHGDEEANKMHSYLLYNALRSEEEPNLLVPPHSGGNDPNEGGNPTDFLLILGVISTELEKVGILEIFQRPGTNPTTQNGYLQFVRQATRYATEYYKDRQLRNFSDRQGLWTQLEDFTRNIHKTLDLKETLYTVANESRRLIECDRVSIAICHGSRAKIEAVSGQDMVDKRSEAVRLLGSLASAVVAVTLMSAPVPAPMSSGIPCSITPQRLTSSFASFLHACTSSSPQMRHPGTSSTVRTTPAAAPRRTKATESTAMYLNFSKHSPFCLNLDWRHYTKLTCLYSKHDERSIPKIKKLTSRFKRPKRTLHHVPENAEEVADRTGKHKQMPDHVRIGEGLPKIEDAAEGVESAADGKPHRAKPLQRPD